MSKPGAKLLRAKWNSLGKKGLEASGNHNSDKGLNNILQSDKHGGSKFLNLVAAAVKQQKNS